MTKHLTEAEFLQSVASHKLEILHEDGVYRHIRLKKPDTRNMYFDLVTYPGFLVYSGDMGCFVFERLNDMFQFFRTSESYRRDYPNRTLFPNHGYWSEKLQAVDGCREGNVREFDEERFNRIVIEYLVTWIREHRDLTSKEERRELWDEVIAVVIDADSDNGGYRKQIAAHDFRTFVNERVGRFEFIDFWERSVTRYTHTFQWACFAIEWGIQQYDAAKAAGAKEAA